MTTTTAQTQIRTTLLKQADLTNVFVELVPDPRWRERMAAGQPPNMFYSVKGDIQLEADGAVVNAELNLGALNDNGALLLLGIERPNRDGKVRSVLPNSPKGHAIGLQLDADGKPIIKDGVPQTLEPSVSFPSGWSVFHVVKYHVNVDGAKALRLTNVQIAYDGVVDSRGRLCAKVRATSYAIVDGPARLQAAGVAADWTGIGSSQAYAARRNARATAAAAAPMLSAGNVAESLADAAATLGANML